ncbi:hypothetical protein MPSEU_000111600 [Mayamaea pseudoterrestris]|nr:hypothetical protein MPSEU_000111600 [Mayamaea pseudoterrestris]
MLPAFIKIASPPPLSPQDSSDDLLLSHDKELHAAEGKTIVTSATDCSDLVSAISEFDFNACQFRVSQWDKKTKYSDYIRSGLDYLKRRESVIMLFEAPSTASDTSSFFNSQSWAFHDYPPSSNAYKTMLGPCRYSLMNGTAFPTYLQAGTPTTGLLEHWIETVPGFETPTFVSEIPADDLNVAVYAYLPTESIKNHMNDPYVHYHLAGKDALHLMTTKTTKLMATTKQRPCIAKVTHSMASKGIFIIRNDEDEREFEEFLETSGNPPYVVTALVDIDRNVACHCFVHPNGEVTFFGSNENYKREDGSWSMDSYLMMRDQALLQEIQLPFVEDVAKYCHSLGYWGFCGVDVLFDGTGQGYLVDVNPRVTGSCPSLMVGQLLQDKYGFDFGLFRRNGNITYQGSAAELFAEVKAFNVEHEGSCQVVLFGAYEEAPDNTKVNIGIYSHSIERCEEVLYHFVQ